MPEVTRQLITMQRVNADKSLTVFYPKTIASQVYINANTTLADHVTDTDVHLLPTERTALTNTNSANGYVKLDANGLVPTGMINPSVLAINRQYNNIAGLLAANANDVVEGQLVMVVDASADSTVTSGWAIYRRLVGSSDLTQLSSWQKIAEAESIDVTVTWDSISGKPNNTAAEIEQAVTDDHTHANKEVLDLITYDTAGLKYNGNLIAFDSDVTHFVVAETSNVQTAITNVNTGTIVLEVTGTGTF